MTIIKLKRRQGFSLFLALTKTIPGHYAILRTASGRFSSLVAAIRLAYCTLGMK